MNPDERRRRSKFLSYVLRHHPEAIGLSLDDHGWASVSELLTCCADHGEACSMAELVEIVQTSPKQRFAFGDGQDRIRASQGHSVAVELGYEAKQPPEALFHGTVAASLPAIKVDGLRKMSRHAVHLSPDRDAAAAVGRRRGPPVILTIAAGEMARDGVEFQQSDNDVWLVDHVPAAYISFPDD